MKEVKLYKEKKYKISRRYHRHETIICLGVLGSGALLIVSSFGLNVPIMSLSTGLFIGFMASLPALMEVDRHVKPIKETRYHKTIFIDDDDVCQPSTVKPDDDDDDNDDDNDDDDNNKTKVLNLQKSKEQKIVDYVNEHGCSISGASRKLFGENFKLTGNHYRKINRILYGRSTSFKRRSKSPKPTKKRSRKNNKLTQQDWKLVAGYEEKGLTGTEIAKRMPHMNRGTIYNMMHRLRKQRGE